MKNQILVTKSKSNETVETCPPLSQFSKKQDWFKFQFAFSLCILVVSALGGCFYFYQLNKKEDFSDKLLANYNVYRLYRSRYFYFFC